jgi:hypothetical protein
LGALMHERRIHDQRLDQCHEHDGDDHDSSNRPAPSGSVSDSFSGMHGTYPFPVSTLRTGKHTTMTALLFHLYELLRNCCVPLLTQNAISVLR